jgi:hypothetical protein
LIAGLLRRQWRRFGQTLRRGLEWLVLLAPQLLLLLLPQLLLLLLLLMLQLLLRLGLLLLLLQ